MKEKIKNRMIIKKSLKIEWFLRKKDRKKERKYNVRRAHKYIDIVHW